MVNPSHENVAMTVAGYDIRSLSAGGGHECEWPPSARSATWAFYDIVDDPNDLGSGVDARELFGHLSGAEAVDSSIEHGAHRVAQRIPRGFIGWEIDADARPRDPRIDVGLGQSHGDQRNAKAHGPIDAAIATVGHEHADAGQQQSKGNELATRAFAGIWPGIASIGRPPGLAITSTSGSLASAANVEATSKSQL